MKSNKIVDPDGSLPGAGGSLVGAGGKLLDSGGLDFLDYNIGKYNMKEEACNILKD